MAIKSGYRLAAIAVGFIASLGGCRSLENSELNSDQAWIQPWSPTLVMPSLNLHDFVEFSAESEMAHVGGDVQIDSRNDSILGSYPGQGIDDFEAVYVRHWEYLRVINGRTRDYSITRTESVKRGMVR